ncbi:MAG: hypothetical protein ACLFUS_15200, partial [Candidatus Sumerlaeia bacterium]
HLAGKSIPDRITNTIKHAFSYAESMLRIKAPQQQGEGKSSYSKTAKVQKMVRFIASDLTQPPFMSCTPMHIRFSFNLTIS